MKIVYTCSYAYPSISGVWTRVENLAKQLIKKGHEIHVLTSNVIAGTDNLAEPYESYNGIHIHRFPVKIKFSKYQLLFSGKKFTDVLEKIKPDVIDCQTYRHSEAKEALEYALKNKIPCFLTTHAPFLPIKVRGIKLTILAKLYDLLIGKRILKKYSGILRISDWEMSHLLKLGVEENKIIYSPNGIPEQFFKAKTENKKNNRVLFLGRIEPRKQVHVLIEAFAKIPNAELLLAGPIENEGNYEQKLKLLIKQNKLEEKVKLLGPIYDLDKKIKLMNSCQIYVLPSTWEGFPQSLIEAMSLGRIIIASDCEGNKEVIKDNKTGFLFPVGNLKKLTEKLEYCLRNQDKLSKIRKNAKEIALNFKWETLADNVEKIYLKELCSKK